MLILIEHEKKTYLTFSKFSFLLTITAVICWSMYISMVARRAGAILTSINHHGFFGLIGLIIHGRPDLDG